MKFNTLSTAISVSIFVLSARADWKFHDYSTPANPQGVCMLYSVEKTGKTELRLEIVRQKGGGGPAEVFVREFKASTGSVAWMASAQTTSPFLFAEMINDGQQRSFLHIPVNTQILVDHLAAGRKLTLVSVGLKKELKVDYSKNNFDKALMQFQNQCLAGQPLVDREFEKQFLSGQNLGTDVSKLQPQDVLKMRALYGQAYQNYLEQLRQQQKIQELDRRYDPTLREYKQVTDRIQSLNQVEIPQLERNIQTQISNRVRAEQSLREIKDRIPALRTQAQRDRTAYDRALAARAPFEAENDQLVSDLNSAIDYRQKLETYLQQIIGDTSRAEAQLRSSRADLDSIRRALPDLEWRMRRANDEMREARRQRDSFDYNFELRRRLDREPRVQRLRNEVQNLDREINGFERQAERARVERDQARAALQRCKINPEANCALEERALERADVNLNNVVNSLRDAHLRRDNAARELDSIVSSIEREVRRELEFLENRLRQAIDNHRFAQNEYDQALQTARNLEVQVIPRLERELRQLELAQAQTERDLTQARSDIARAERSLQAFRQRVGWDRLTAEVDRTGAQYGRSQEQLDRAVREQSRLENVIVSSERQQRELESTLSQRQAELAQLRQREVALSGTISRYRQEKAPLEAEMNSILARFKQTQVEYRALLP